MTISLKIMQENFDCAKVIERESIMKQLGRIVNYWEQLGPVLSLADIFNLHISLLNGKKQWSSSPRFLNISQCTSF